MATGRRTRQPPWLAGAAGTGGGWRCIVLLLLLGWVPGPAADTTAPVPIDHWVYQVLERLETRGLLANIGDGLRPLSRAQIVRWLRQAHRQDLLVGTDRARVEELLAEFGPFDGEPGLQAAPPGAQAVPLRYGADNGWIEADLLVRQQTDVLSGRRDAAEWIFRQRLGGLVRGQLGERVGFRVGFEQTREEGARRTYTIRSDVFETRREAVQLKGNVADYHEATVSISFGLAGVADVVAGKGQLLWGPAPEDNLGLSANAPSYDMILLRSRLGALRFVHVAARLRPCPDRPDAPRCRGLADDEATYVVNGITRTLEREKYMAAHRLEISPASWLDIGLQEVVVYGDRGPQAAYLNPFMFFWAAQSYLGDRDNVMMTFDVEMRPRPGWRLYAAYAVDDLKKLKVFSNDFANKFSFQTGLLWTDPLGLRDVDVRSEYVRIEPWIYTHKFPINTFRHFDAPLGHALGPNSDRWQASIVRRWTHRLETRLRWSTTRHGYNERLADGTIRNVGGDLHLGWRPGDDRQAKRFLDGQRSTRHAVAAELEWQLVSRLRLNAQVEWEWGTGVALPPRWQYDVPLPWRTGFGDGLQVHGGLDLRYGFL